MKSFNWGATRPKVLVADDDPVFLELLSTILQNAGCDVARATSATEALEHIQKTPGIDLAILDIELGNTSGIDLAESLHPMPVVFVTNHDEQHVMEEALTKRPHLRALSYISKVLEPRRIALIVHAAVTFARETRTKERVMEDTAHALEVERRRIAHELHDELAMVLVSVLYDTKEIERSSEDEGVKAAAGRILNHLELLNNSIQRIIDRLRPEVLDTLGLHRAIETLVEDWRRRLPGTAFEMTIDYPLDTIDDATASMLYRVVQECLTNIAKHAHATAVTIALLRKAEGNGDTVAVRVVDNGVGFKVGTTQYGHGLSGIAHRSTALGGRVAINSQPGEGTKVTIELPMRMRK